MPGTIRPTFKNDDGPNQVPCSGCGKLNIKQAVPFEGTWEIGKGGRGVYAQYCLECLRKRQEDIKEHRAKAAKKRKAKAAE